MLGISQGKGRQRELESVSSSTKPSWLLLRRNTLPAQGNGMQQPSPAALFLYYVLKGLRTRSLPSRYVVRLRHFFAGTSVGGCGREQMRLI